MLLSVLVVGQLIVDVVLAVLVVACLVRTRGRRTVSGSPPAWSRELSLLARDLLAVAGPLLDAAERRATGVPDGLGVNTTAAPPVARPLRPLLPGEQRLVASLAAARSRA